MFYFLARICMGACICPKCHTGLSLSLRMATQPYALSPKRVLQFVLLFFFKQFEILQFSATKWMIAKLYRTDAFARNAGVVILELFGLWWDLGAVLKQRRSQLCHVDLCCSALRPVVSGLRVGPPRRVLHGPCLLLT